MSQIRKNNYSRLKNFNVYVKNKLFGQQKSKFTNLLVFIFFLIFSIFINRNIIFSSDFIGFNHDWSFPMTNSDLGVFCSQAFYGWVQPNAGYAPVYPAENLYHFLIYPLQIFGFTGLQVIDLILIFVFTFSGYFMFLLLKNSFKLSFTPSFISSLFYATTPVIFNKLAAGHVPYIIAYALAPLIMFCFIRYTDKLEKKYLIITSLLVAFASIQIQFAIMLLFLLFFYAILIAKIKPKGLVKAFIPMLLIFSLIHSFWILPAFSNSFSSFTSTLTNANDTSNLLSMGTTIGNSIRLIGYRSWHFELVLANDPNNIVWYIVSLILVSFSFISILFKKRLVPLFFAGIAIITLIFTTVGPFGFILQPLYSAFPVFNIFREVYHLTFLIAFSYSVILAFTINNILASKKVKKYLKIAFAVVMIACVILNDPYIYSGNYSNQVPQYQLNNQNQSIINGYLNDSENYRVLYLPMIVPLEYEGLTTRGLDHVISYSSKPTIGNYMQSDFQKYLATTFYVPSSNLSNILNILSVRYLFFRNDTQSKLPEYLTGGILNIENGAYNITSIWTNDNILNNLMNQSSLILLKNDNGLTVFENPNYLPLVYPATNSIALTGNLTVLYDYLQSSSTNLTNRVLFLSEQVPDQSQWQFINELQQSEQSNAPIITFNEVDPTKYSVTVENATVPFFLVFNENYDSNWKAYVGNNATSVSDTLHFTANGYANAWYIDPQANNENTTFTITLYYTPQNYYNAGLIIAGITTIVCVSYLIASCCNFIFKKKLMK